MNQTEQNGAATTDHLALCPYCGGPAQDDFIVDVSYIIECYWCGASTDSQGSPDAAVAAWNRRAITMSDADWAVILKRYEDAGDRQNADIIRKQWDAARGRAQSEEILALHRQLASEKLRADLGWARAAAKSQECIELRERMAAGVASALPAIMGQARADVEALGNHITAGINLMARGAASMVKALSLAQADAGIPVSVQVQSVDDLVAMLVDRDTPPGMDDDEVVDWDLHGKPITRRMVSALAQGGADPAPPSDQMAFELPTGEPVIRSVGAAIDAAAADAAAQGVADLNLPANVVTRMESEMPVFAIVKDYRFGSDLPALAYFNGSEYEFGDGDCFQRQGNTLAGFPAEFMTLYELERKMLDTAFNSLGAMLWLYRRLSPGYGRVAVIEGPIKALAHLFSTDVADCLAERGPDPVEGGAQ